MGVGWLGAGVGGWGGGWQVVRGIMACWIGVWVFNANKAWVVQYGTCSSK